MKVKDQGNSITIILPKGMGICHCGKPAKHKEWSKFDPPIPAQFGFPACHGIWHFVCDKHKNPA
jgi:hypothetical protein